MPAQSLDTEKEFINMGITQWKQKEKDDNGKITYPVKVFAEKTAEIASKTHNYPADIINIVTEELKKKYYEFPTFKQLDREIACIRRFKS